MLQTQCCQPLLVVKGSESGGSMGLDHPENLMKDPQLDVGVVA